MIERPIVVVPAWYVGVSCVAVVVMLLTSPQLPAPASREERVRDALQAMARADDSIHAEENRWRRWVASLPEPPQEP